MSAERMLLDATFVAGYLNPRDQHHAEAVKRLPQENTYTNLLTFLRMHPHNCVAVGAGNWVA